MRKAQACGFLSPGRVAEIPTEPGDDCWARCVLGRATCADLETIICDSGSSTLEDECGVACDEITTCADGSTVGTGFRCDGTNDCADGADEVGCDAFLFTCADGSKVPSDWRCDGDNDCASGTDEAGCSYFTCADGTNISQRWVCNFEEDCPGGEDEVGCATRQCPPSP